MPYSYRYASQPVHVSHMEPTCPAPKGKEQPFEFDPALPPLVARDMDRFRRAVLTEMCCLRDQGGHEVHITNGTLVGRHAAGFAYVFDLESELFLADDAPVRLSVGGKAVDGIVLACEEFQITLLLQQNMGESISSAVLSANPWQLLEAQRRAKHWTFRTSSARYARAWQRTRCAAFTAPRQATATTRASTC